MKDGEGPLWKVRVRRWGEFLARDIKAATKEEAEEQAAELYATPYDEDSVDGGFDWIEAEPEDE